MVNMHMLFNRCLQAGKPSPGPPFEDEWCGEPKLRMPSCLLELGRLRMSISSPREIFTRT
jgi:hypothetical protein